MDDLQGALSLAQIRADILATDLELASKQLKQLEAKVGETASDQLSEQVNNLKLDIAKLSLELWLLKKEGIEPRR